MEQMGIKGIAKGQLSEMPKALDAQGAALRKWPLESRPDCCGGLPRRWPRSRYCRDSLTASLSSGPGHLYGRGCGGGASL